MKFKFVHAADIHLDSPLKGLERYDGAPVDDLRSATRRAFQNLVSACIDNEAAFLLLAGDLYDGDWKDYNTGLFLLKELARLGEAGITTYVVSGNHDAENGMTKSLARPAHMHVLSHKKPETVLIPALRVAIHGQSYAQYDIQTDLSLSYPPPEPGMFNIGLLHTSADGRASEHKTYAPCTVPGLVGRGYDYWALGHVHRRQVLHESPWVVSPGNLQGRHIKETGAKGAMLVTVEDGRVTLEHRPLDVMRWALRTVDLAGVRTGTEAIERVQRDLVDLRKQEPVLPLAVRVVLQGACEAHPELISQQERWTSEIRALSVGHDELWIEKVKFNTRSAIDLDALRQQPSPLGELLRTIQAQRGDPSALAGLGHELRVLQEKVAFLPAEDRPAVESEADLRALLDDAGHLLIPMLLEAEVS